MRLKAVKALKNQKNKHSTKIKTTMEITIIIIIMQKTTNNLKENSMMMMMMMMTNMHKSATIKYSREE